MFKDLTQQPNASKYQLCRQEWRRRAQPLLLSQLTRERILGDATRK
jgi:hypothetical protein